jgi:hypothetical protein
LKPRRLAAQLMTLANVRGPFKAEHRLCFRVRGSARNRNAGILFSTDRVSLVDEWHSTDGRQPHRPQVRRLASASRMTVW